MSASYKFDKVPLKVAQKDLTLDSVVDGTYVLVLVTSAVFDNFGTGALSDNEYWYDISGTEINVVGSGYNSDGYTGPDDLINVGTYEV